MRELAALGSAAAALLPSALLAGSTLESFAFAALVQPETVEGGSLIGPPESRATWNFLGGIRPVDGSAMAVFATGDLGENALPGIDLGAVGPADDRSGLNLSLRVPEAARTLRVAVAFVTAEGAGSDDRARVLVQGDPVALDPWSLGDLGPDTVGVVEDPALSGTSWAGGRHLPWVEVLVPVEPGSLITVRVEVEDGGDSFIDSALLLDGVRFEPAALDGLGPGLPPRIDAPGALWEPRCGPLTVTGARLASVLLWRLRCPGGVEVLSPTEVHLRSDGEVGLGFSGEPGARCTLEAEHGGGTLVFADAVGVGHEPPRVWSAMPASGLPTGGGLLRLEGRSLLDPSAVRLGGVASPVFRSEGCAVVEAIVPADLAGRVDIEVDTAFGTATLVEGYVVASEEITEPGPPEPTYTAACSALGPGSGPLLFWVSVVGFGRRRGSGPTRKAWRC